MSRGSLSGKLLLATRNRDKIVEIKELLAGLPVEVVTLDEYPQVPEVVEDGDTLEANALKKARVVFESTGVPSVADDTGLQVAILNGAPGVCSSRYSGENASYSDNVAKLLAEMQGVPEAKRQARFRTVVAYVDAKSSRTVAGNCEGIICESPRGSQGFGYDPVFFVPEYNQTFAEMTTATKNQISHRARAFREFRDLLVNQKIDLIGA